MVLVEFIFFNRFTPTDTVTEYAGTLMGTYYIYTSTYTTKISYNNRYNQDPCYYASSCP